MKKFAVAIVFIALTLGAYYFYNQLTQVKAKLALIENRLGQGSLECDEQETIERVSKSLVRVVGGEGEGTGVIVKSNGTIATNFHVIQFEPSPKVIFPDYSFEPAEIILADRNADLAYLRINRTDLEHLNFDTISQQNLVPLQPVLAFGYPFGVELAGGVTVQKGNFVSVRHSEGQELLQTDISLNPGQSGGALTDLCGNLVGINSAGVAGLGMAITSTYALDTWFQLLNAEDPLVDVEKIDFLPNESALEAVKAFYNYQKVRKLEEAYQLLSDNFLQGGSYESWRIGYEPLMDTYLLEIKEVEDEEDVISLKLVTQELVGENIVTKYFEGVWECRQEDGVWRLYDPEIVEVTEPGWEWFYGDEET